MLKRRSFFFEKFLRILENSLQMLFAFRTISSMDIFFKKRKLCEDENEVEYFLMPIFSYFYFFWHSYFLLTRRLMRDRREWEGQENIRSFQTRCKSTHWKYTFICDNVENTWKYGNSDTYSSETLWNICFSLVKPPSNRSYWNALFIFCEGKPPWSYFL